MAVTLFDITLKVGRALNAIREGTATGGTASTLIDTNDLTQEDDFWNGGSIWVVRDAAGAGALPEGQWGIISSFDNGTSTATIRTAITAIATGDRYAIADDEFPLDRIISQVNAALDDMGYITIVDTSAITTADNQTEHSLPAACVGDKLKQVWLQTNTSDSNDNRWVKIFNWRVIEGATGAADTLVLPYQYGSGMDVMLKYVGKHASLYEYDDELSESVPINQVVYRATLNMLRYNKETWGTTQHDDAILKYEMKVNDLHATDPLSLPHKDAMRHQFDAVGSALETVPNRVVLK